jgi:hypothetical protein
MNMEFGAWNVRSLYRAGSLKTAASELAKYKLNLMAVQEFRWDKASSELADNYKFFHGNGNTSHHLWIGFFVHKGIISAVDRVEFVTGYYI